MLRIGICDDDEAARRELYGFASKSLFQYTDMRFYYYTDGQEIIDQVVKGDFQPELLLLDINMPKKDGITVANYIRRYNADVDIIFVTVSRQHVFQGYQYKAYGYCLKPIADSTLPDVLVRYMEERKDSTNCINVTVNGQVERIPLNRVIFFESQKRKIIIHMSGEDVTYYGKMNDLENALPDEQFFRCHQSYIVNRECIDSIRRTEIVVSGLIIPMSRRYYESMSKEEPENTKSMMITKSLALNSEEKGAIIFTGGKLLGTIIHMNDEQKITLGRDSSQADIIINSDTVSRLHCSIVYHGVSNTYTVCDVSKNGVFIGRDQRLAKDVRTTLKPGVELWIGDELTRIRLG